MSMLTDDELGLILKRIVEPYDRKSASLVCKKWLIEEGQARSSLTVFRIDYLPRLLVRFPNLVAFRTTEPITSSDQLKLVAEACPKLETFFLDYIWFGSDEDREDRILTQCEVWDEGLSCIANGCPKLSKIVLRRRGIGTVGFKSLITSPAGHNLSHLELSHSYSVRDEMLEAIGSTKSPISVLNLQNTKISDAGLAFLADGSCSETIKHLDLGWCYDITDYGVSLLRKMRVLEELNLRCCTSLTDVGGVSISAVSTLKKLDLEGLSLVTDCTVAALAQNCPSLEMLDLNRNKRVFTGAGIRSFCGHKRLEFLKVVDCLNEISGDDLESLALGCPSLKSIWVEIGLKERLLLEMQETTVSKLVRFL